MSNIASLSDSQRDIETETRSQALHDEYAIAVASKIESCTNGIDALGEARTLLEAAKYHVQGANMYSETTDIQTMINDLDTLAVTLEIHKAELEEE